MAEPPNPVNFDPATKTVTEEDVAEAIPHGPDPEPYVMAVKTLAGAGFDHISILPVGDDLEEFLKFWETEVQPALKDSA